MSAYGVDYAKLAGRGFIEGFHRVVVVLCLSDPDTLTRVSAGGIVELPRPSRPPPMINWCIRSKAVRFIIGFIVSTHRLSCPARPAAPPPPFPLDQTQAPTSLKTSPSPHRLFDLQDSLDKLMHFPPQLAVRFCPPQKRVLWFPRTC